jgi:hypothetical protein
LREHATATLAGSVYFGPGSVHYSSPILQAQNLGPEETLLAIERLESIATAAERIAAPQTSIKASWLERLSKDHPFIAGFVILSAILAGLLVVVGLILALATLVLG